MKGKLWRGIALVLLSLALITVSGLVGCAKDETGDREIVIGILTDFTGAGSFAIKPTVEAMQDYFKMIQEEGQLPGARVKFVTYDTKLDYSRVMPGYESLKAKGVVMMHVLNPADKDIVTIKATEDKMPVVSSQETTGHERREWVFNAYAPISTEVEAILQYLMEDWDYDTKGPIKIGHLGWMLETTDYHQEGIDNIMEEYPGKFEFIGLERAPMGTSSWAGEISKLKSCDYILMSAVGSMMATFIRESRDRGYEGGFLSGINAFPGYWDNARAIVPAANLYECYYAGQWPWWNEDVEFIDSLKSAVQKYRAGDAARFRSSGPITGWCWGWFMADAVKRAVDKVGAENVDREAIKEALETTNLTVDGFGNVWNLDKGQFFVWQKKVFKWNITTSDWEAVSNWITPVSLAD
jgi:ABC-type branched-subunit amino acid transport system substrate-binding protein